eukprot:m.60215 g.60215  ORF g.60215 m.60215 type:complete len:52 (+) comp7261_c0_seq1:81-236(+)
MPAEERNGSKKIRDSDRAGACPHGGGGTNVSHELESSNKQQATEQNEGKDK